MLSSTFYSLQGTFQSYYGFFFNLLLLITLPLKYLWEFVNESVVIVNIFLASWGFTIGENVKRYIFSDHSGIKFKHFVLFNLTPHMRIFDIWNSVYSLSPSRMLFGGLSHILSSTSGRLFISFVENITWRVFFCSYFMFHSCVLKCSIWWDILMLPATFRAISTLLNTFILVI